MKMTKQRTELLLYLERNKESASVPCDGRCNRTARDLVKMGLADATGLYWSGFRINDAGRKAIGVEK